MLCRMKPSLLFKLYEVELENLFYFLRYNIFQKKTEKQINCNTFTTQFICNLTGLFRFFYILKFHPFFSLRIVGEITSFIVVFLQKMCMEKQRLKLQKLLKNKVLCERIFFFFFHTKVLYNTRIYLFFFKEKVISYNLYYGPCSLSNSKAVWFIHMYKITIFR